MVHDSKVCHDEDDIRPRKSPGWVGCGNKNENMRMQCGGGTLLALLPQRQLQMSQGMSILVLGDCQDQTVVARDPMSASWR